MIHLFEKSFFFLFFDLKEIKLTNNIILIINYFVFINSSDQVLNKSESVTLEPTPYNYSHSKNYQQMYSGTPYPFGLDPVSLN